jgi:hypothetical protein
MDFSQVLYESLGSTICGVVTVKTEWELPSLYLTTATCIIFAWSKPFVWFVKLDVCKERHLIYWSLRQSFNSNLLIRAIDFKSKSLSDITCVCPNESSLSVTSVSDSSMSWW